MILSEKEAIKIYDILQKYCGAIDYWRDNFIYVMSHDNVHEYRFQGSLGFGGKFWSDDWKVSCYKEDETPERKTIIKIANKALKKIKK